MTMSDAVAVPKVLRITRPDLFLQRGVTLPGQVLSLPRVAFQPSDYYIGSEDGYLKPKLITSEHQRLGMENFLAHPGKSCVFAVGSEPDDLAAKYVAAFLLQEYLVKHSNTLARWYPLHDNTPLIKNDAPCSFLVLTGLTPEATPYRLEKARDLIEHYHHIPRIVVIGGMDPITFMLTKLRLKPTHFFYQGKGINRKLEVV